MVIKIIIEHFIKTPEISAGSKTNLVPILPAKISAIYLYPIKSCGALKVTKGSWPLSETCLKFDRQFVIMQGRSTLTQRREPLLCQICPKIDLKTKIMTLSVPWVDAKCELNLATIEGTETLGQICSGKVCGDQIEGLDCGDLVSEWLEQVLGLTGNTFKVKIHGNFGFKS